MLAMYDLAASLNVLFHFKNLKAVLIYQQDINLA